MEQMLKDLVNVRTYMIHSKFWFVHLSSIKFLTRYYLMFISYHNVISGYKYTEYNITALTQYNVIILIESQNYFFIFFITESAPNNL